MSAENAKASINDFLALAADRLKDQELGPWARAFGKARKLQPTEDSVAPLIVAARSDPYAFDSCAELLDTFIQNDQTPPDNLLLMARDVMRGDLSRPGKRGRDSMKNYGRDSVIIQCVALAELEGLPTYAHGHPTETACTVTAECLKAHGVFLEADAIEKVQEKYRRGQK